MKIINMDNFNEKTYDLLNVIVGCDIVVVFNDKLKGTQAHKGKLKVHSRALGKEAESVLKSNLKNMFDTNQEIYQNVVVNMEQFVETISKSIVNLRPDNFLELNQIIKMYCENQEAFRDSFEITLRKLDERKTSEGET